MPPVVIAGGIAAAGAIGSAAIGASSAKKAAKASQAGADASIAAQERTYASNTANLSPYMQRGNVAGDYLNAMLGLPSATTTSITAASPQNALAGNTGGLVGAAARDGRFDNIDPRIAAMFPNAAAQGILNGQQPGQVQQPGTVTATNPGVTQADAQNAFGNYIKNSDYGFQFATGANGVNSGYAGNGTLQSGAAMKALEGYRQNLQAGYRGEYMGALGNQQGVGLSGASALAGVGQSYANSLGTIYGNNAANRANASLVAGANTGQALNSLATIGSNVFGQMGGGNSLVNSVNQTVARNPGIF